MTIKRRNGRTVDELLARTGADRVHLMVGEREIVVHDKDLAARILNAAGGR